MDRDGVGGGAPTNPTHPDWPDPSFPTVATPAEQLPWPLNEIFGGRTLTSQELRDLGRFLDPYTLRRLRTDADYALEDAGRTREWSDKQREYARRWRELAEDAEREAEKWRRNAEETDDPESRRRYEEFAEDWEKDARDRRERAGSYDEYAEKEDARAKEYQDRHDQAVEDAERAVREAEEKVAAEQEAERLAREQAEKERIQKEQEKRMKEYRERQARWEAERAEREQKAAEERRTRLAEEAREKEFNRLDGISARAHGQLKEAEERLRRDPNNPRYQREYRIRQARYNRAQNNLAGFMEGDSQGGRTPSSSMPGAGPRDTGPSASTVIGHQAQDRALDVTGKVAGNLLAEGSTTAGRTAAGAALGQVVDLKTVYDLGASAQEVVDQAPEQIQKETDAIEDPNADPMELRRHQLGHLGQRVRTLLDSSSPF